MFGSKLASGLLLTLAAGLWSTAAAQIFDFSGQWLMSTEVLLPGEAEPCSFFGTAQVEHDLQQGTLRGTAVLELVTGPPACPAEMAGEITGNPDGATIFNGMLFGGVLGEATFTGGVPQGPGIKGFGLGGGFDVIVGPFKGLSGDWGAVISDGVFYDGFETLIVVSSGGWLLLLGAGMLIYRRRRD